MPTCQSCPRKDQPAPRLALCMHLAVFLLSEVSPFKKYGPDPQNFFISKCCTPRTHSQSVNNVITVPKSKNTSLELVVVVDSLDGARRFQNQNFENSTSISKCFEPQNWLKSVANAVQSQFQAPKLRKTKKTLNLSRKRWISNHNSDLGNVWTGQNAGSKACLTGFHSGGITCSHQDVKALYVYPNCKPIAVSARRESSIAAAGSLLSRGNAIDERVDELGGVLQVWP